MKSTEETIDIIKSHLRGKGWVTAKKIELETGLDEREIRKAASESDNEIVAGQKGYCLFTECRAEEIRRSALRLISQSKQMRSRADNLLFKMNFTPQFQTA